jgi:hypothetical protein
MKSKKYALYLFPFFSSISIFIIVTGTFSSVTYSVTVYGIAARIIGFGMLSLSIFIVYDYLKNSIDYTMIKWQKLLSLYLCSAFNFFWQLSIILILTAYCFKKKSLADAYFIIIIICGFAQRRFLNKLSIYGKEKIEK